MSSPNQPEAKDPLKTVYCIVATYNGLKWVDSCFGSLRKSRYPVQVIAVDNGSTDGTVEAIENNFPEIDLIKTGSNNGFGEANNIGIRKALDRGADYLFLLNLDAWVDPDTVGSLVEVAENHPSFGIISPMQLNGSDTGLDFLFSTYIEPEKCPGLYSDIYMGRTKDLYPAVNINAAAWCVRSEVFSNVGLFDDLFFVYGVDDNFVDRVKYHGYQVGVTPRAKIWHDREVRGSAKKDVKTNYDAQLNRMKVIALNPNVSLPVKILALKRKCLSDMISNLQMGNIPSLWGNLKVLFRGMWFIARHHSRYR